MYLMPPYIRWALWLLFLLTPLLKQAQPSVKVTRILFVLDASGSMAAPWHGEPRIEIAKRLLLHAIDSIEAANPAIEFGLRMFGHQSPNAAKDCRDTRLEVPFGQNNATAIRQALDRIKVQGQTPIAHSLFEASQDFPSDPQSKNVIILITDGLETCEGDPCALAPVMHKRNIALRPFIIGLGLAPEVKHFFDCVGTFYDAGDPRAFENVIRVVISQAINATTAQINLLDAAGQPNETNVEITLQEHHLGSVEYRFVHAREYYGRIDTLYLPPVIEYDMTVHTVPPVKVPQILLTPGRHNIIAADAPQGTLTVRIDGFSRPMDARCVIRQAGESGILDVMALNSRKQLLTGIYSLEISTLPPLYHEQVRINPGDETVVMVPATGRVSFNTGRGGILSVYQVDGGQMRMIYEERKAAGTFTVDILPGTYTAVYRQELHKSSDLTKTREFTVLPRGNTTVVF
jgi:Ca-activated chloride channel homolog